MELFGSPSRNRARLLSICTRTCAAALTAALATGFATAGLARAAEISIKVSAPAIPHAISPYIYGVNQNPGGDIARFPLVRQGGNRMTAWNWENNASNAGSDWRHQSDNYLGGGEIPGEVARLYIEPAIKNKQVAIVTIPMAGYVSADKGPEGDVNQTPDYLNKRFKKSLPAKPGGAFAYPPDLTDDFVYQDEFVAWAEKTFDPDGGHLWYALDNEPDIWDGTHARLRTKKLTYAELVDRTVQWSTAIKAVAPKTTIFGFVSYGYNGFATLQNAPDGAGRFFVDVFLKEMAAAEKSAGHRLVDVLDLHWYPETQGGGKRITEATGPAAAEARMQAPRHLYDPSFRENSWIDRDAVKGPINLLPTMLQKIADFYPGTKLAFTEFNYGGGEDISGTIAHADALGAFGHAGVFAACWWSLAEKNPFTAAAYDLFLNYDGKGSRFGSTALDATSSDLAKISAWAAKTGDGKTTLLLINRSKAEETVAISGLSGKCQTYRVTAASARIAPLPDIEAAGPMSLPAESVTLLIAR